MCKVVKHYTANNPQQDVHICVSWKLKISIWLQPMCLQFQTKFEVTDLFVKFNKQSPLTMSKITVLNCKIFKLTTKTNRIIRIHKLQIKLFNHHKLNMLLNCQLITQSKMSMLWYVWLIKTGSINLIKFWSIKLDAII